MPNVSEVQRAAMAAAAKGDSTLGIPKSVGKDFMAADKGGKLPAQVKDGKPKTRGERWYSSKSKD